jgi:hypothetical protein
VGIAVRDLTSNRSRVDAEVARPERLTTTRTVFPRSSRTCRVPRRGASAFGYLRGELVFSGCRSRSALPALEDALLPDLRRGDADVPGEAPDVPIRDERKDNSVVRRQYGLRGAVTTERCGHETRIAGPGVTRRAGTTDGVSAPPSTGVRRQLLTPVQLRSCCRCPNRRSTDGVPAGTGHAVSVSESIFGTRLRTSSSG